MSDIERVEVVVARLRSRRRWGKALVKAGLPFLAVGLVGIGLASGVLQVAGSVLFSVGLLMLFPGLTLWIFSEAT